MGRQATYTLPLVGALLTALGLVGAFLGYAGLYPLAISSGIVVLGTTIYIWRRDGWSLLLAWLILVGLLAAGIGVLGYFVVL